MSAPSWLMEAAEDIGRGSSPHVAPSVERILSSKQPAVQMPEPIKLFDAEHVKLPAYHYDHTDPRCPGIYFPRDYIQQWIAKNGPIELDGHKFTDAAAFEY